MLRSVGKQLTETQCALTASPPTCNCTHFSEFDLVLSFKPSCILVFSLFFFWQMTATAQQPAKAQPVHISTPSAAASTPLPSTPIDPQAQLEADKRAVYRYRGILLPGCSLMWIPIPVVACWDITGIWPGANLSKTRCTETSSFSVFFFF